MGIYGVKYKEAVVRLEQQAQDEVVSVHNRNIYRVKYYSSVLISPVIHPCVHDQRTPHTGLQFWNQSVVTHPIFLTSTRLSSAAIRP